jgi:hypothetical protein
MGTATTALLIGAASNAAKRLTPKSMTPNSTRPTADSKAWRPSRVQSFTTLLCSELSVSLSPYTLHRYVKRNAGLEAKLAELFCFSTWTAPFVSDYSAFGAYSRGIAAKIYTQAARRMPRLLLMAAFSKRETVVNMKGFMDNWERAERRFTKDDLALVEQIDAKDRGPFLYWLINERFC